MENKEVSFKITWEKIHFMKVLDGRESPGKDSSLSNTANQQSPILIGKKENDTQ